MELKWPIKVNVLKEVNQTFFYFNHSHLIKILQKMSEKLKPLMFKLLEDKK